MEKTDGRFVITAQKNQCCSYQGGKKEYYFCDGSTELLSELCRLYSNYGGDNYNMYDFDTKERLIECYGEDSEEVKNNNVFPVYAISHSGVVDFKNFTDELEFASCMGGDCGDWSLRYSEEDALDQDERIEILQAEDRFNAAVEEAWSNLWEAWSNLW